MNINYINAIILGYLLVIVAGLINYLAGNNAGFFFALLSVASTYLAENMRVDNLKSAASGFMLLAGLSCLLSYLFWFFG